MKVVSLLHEGTFTGAPIAGLKTASFFSKFITSEVYVIGKSTPKFDEYCGSLNTNVTITSDLNIAKDDLVVCHSGALANVVAKLASRGHSVLWWIHEDTHLFNVADPQAILNAYQQAWGIVTVSPHCAYRTFSKLTWARNAHNVFVVPNTLPFGSEFFTPKLTAENQINILHIGTLGRLKGTDIVLQCAKTISDSTIRFKLVGRMLESQIGQEARGLKNVDIVGEVSPTQVKDLLA